MKRRTFLKSAVWGGAALSAVPGLIGRPAAAPGPPDLAVIQGNSPADIARAAVEALGGM